MVTKKAREKAKAGREKRVAKALPPGEELVFAVQGTAKAPVWLVRAMLLGMLAGVSPGVILAVPYNKMVKHYYLLLTGTAVLLLSIYNTRRVAAAYPLGSVPISRVERGKLITTVYLALPGRKAPVRFAIPQMEKSDLDRLIAVSTLASADQDASVA